MLIAERVGQTEVVIDSDTSTMQIIFLLGDGALSTSGLKTYPNLQILSADLRDHLGLQDAIDLLTRNGVPKESMLWDLNHSNPWRK